MPHTLQSIVREDKGFRVFGWVLLAIAFALPFWLVVFAPLGPKLFGLALFLGLVTPGVKLAFTQSRRWWDPQRQAVIKAKRFVRRPWRETVEPLARFEAVEILPGGTHHSGSGVRFMGKRVSGGETTRCWVRLRHQADRPLHYDSLKSWTLETYDNWFRDYPEALAFAESVAETTGLPLENSLKRQGFPVERALASGQTR